ncbi:Fur family transcriptional regulator [Thermaerobacter composti]|uniref:Fur family transcriptional regulator n=1 Tax=Thermaerobacter composti TaxID=554949 RepID=A0ABZ0QQ59_9FIRM|nr:Fur family transcriptional regulator [Thermaerobacter composti]WPD19630.1 Fur family transcriptional regulator [Thermaerobacter composti]
MALAMDEFRRLLADRGYRVTAQRLAIYELLQENARRSHHPSAEELYQQARERFPMISPATVYNTLELLVELGLASQLGFPGDVQRYDGNPHAHANVQCVDCKTIFDVDAEALEGIGQRVAERSDFVILGQRFEFYGICPRCQERRARERTRGTERSGSRSGAADGSGAR